MSSAWQASNQGRLESIVDALVRRHARNVERCASHRWQLTFGCASGDRNVACTANASWILLDEAIDTGDDPLALIERNAALPHWLKLAVFVDGSVHIRGELPVDDDVDPSDALETVLCAFAGNQPVAVPDAVTPPSLGELSAAAAWPYVDRPDSRIAVELEIPGVFQQAVIDRIPARAVRITADLGADTPIDSAANRTAVAALLLRVAGAVRMVRVAGDCAAEGLRPRLEVILPAAATAADLGHALAALSVACRLCAREVEVLRSDAAAARAYLEGLRS